MIQGGIGAIGRLPVFLNDDLDNSTFGDLPASYYVFPKRLSRRDCSGWSKWALLTTLNQPYWLAGQEHHSTPSIGVTLFNHRQETVNNLLKQADLAMYAAKAAGRNTLRFFENQ
jgi:hypothetical protein